MSTKWTPHKYQKQARKFLLDRDAGGLLLDPGLGKTAIVLSALTRTKGKTLVLAPLRVCHSVWPREVQKWTDFAGLRVVVLHGEDKDDLLETDADVYCCNYEALDWLLGVKRQNACGVKLRGSASTARIEKFDTLVLDELSRCKATNTQRFKMLKGVLPHFKRRWGLTGSPAANGLMDLFGQMYCLDLGEALGRYITHYRMRYFVQHPWQKYLWTLRPGADADIHRQIAPLVLRMSATDYLELPTLMNNEISVDLPPAARELYREMEREMVAEINGRTVVAANAAVVSSKCRQIANGGIYVGDDGSWEDVHNAKADAVAELVGELQGKPLLVAYEYRHDLDRLKKRLGDVPHIGGGVTTKRADAIIRAWNRGEIPVLLGHPASMGHGLNLQSGGCHNICWASITWDYDHYTQFIARVWRQGNDADRVVVHHVVARGTVDEVIMGALQRKAVGQDALFAALKEYARGRR